MKIYFRPHRRAKRDVFERIYACDLRIVSYTFQVGKMSNEHSYFEEKHISYQLLCIRNHLVVTPDFFYKKIIKEL